jgi:hypothetical protein
MRPSSWSPTSGSSSDLTFRCPIAKSSVRRGDRRGDRLLDVDHQRAEQGRPVDGTGDPVGHGERLSRWPACTATRRQCGRTGSVRFCQYPGRREPALERALELLLEGARLGPLRGCVSAAQTPCRILRCLACPQKDSNLRTWLRRPVLYPLSYGGSATEQGYQSAAARVTSGRGQPGDRMPVLAGQPTARGHPA